MYYLDQSKHLRTDWPQPPALQMGQLVGRPERQPTDRIDGSDLYPGDRYGIEREMQFADAAPPEVQALG